MPRYLCDTDSFASVAVVDGPPAPALMFNLDGPVRSARCGAASATLRPCSPQEAPPGAGPWCSSQDSNIWVNVYPYLSSPVTSAGEAVDRLAIVCMFAHFRLLQTCERAGHDGSLEYIDAVLGCALGLFDTTPERLLTGFDDLPLARKNVVVTSVLHAVSWCGARNARARTGGARVVTGSGAMLVCAPVGGLGCAKCSTRSHRSATSRCAVGRAPAPALRVCPRGAHTTTGPVHTARAPTRTGKVLSRLRTLTELEQLLADLLRRHSRFTIAGMTVPLHLLAASSGAATAANGRGRGASGKKGKGKGKAATKAAAAVDDDDDEVRGAGQTGNVAAGLDLTRRSPARLAQ